MPLVGESRLGEFRPAVSLAIVATSSLVWVAGLVLGIITLRRTNADGRAGVFWRTLIGMTLNLTFLGVAVWGTLFFGGLETKLTRLRQKTAEEEAQRVRAKFGSGMLRKKSWFHPQNAHFPRGLENCKRGT